MNILLFQKCNLVLLQLIKNWLINFILRLDVLKKSIMHGIVSFASPNHLSTTKLINKAFKIICLV